MERFIYYAGTGQGHAEEIKVNGVKFRRGRSSKVDQRTYDLLINTEGFEEGEPESVDAPSRKPYVPKPKKAKKTAAAETEVAPVPEPIQQTEFGKE